MSIFDAVYLDAIQTKVFDNQAYGYAGLIYFEGKCDIKEGSAYHLTLMKDCVFLDKEPLPDYGDGPFNDYWAFDQRAIWELGDSACAGQELFLSVYLINAFPEDNGFVLSGVTTSTPTAFFDEKGARITFQKPGVVDMQVIEKISVNSFPESLLRQPAWTPLDSSQQLSLPYTPSF